MNFPKTLRVACMLGLLGCTSAPLAGDDADATDGNCTVAVMIAAESDEHSKVIKRLLDSEAATAANADLLGIDAGRLQEGRLADMVLVDGDPLSDLSVLSDQARLRVFLGGREIQ